MVEQYKLLTESFKGAQLQHHESKVKVIGTGVFVTVSEFKISVPYKKHIIVIENEYGNPVSGKVKMKIEKGLILDFKITAQSHLRNLFSIKKKWFIVDCNNTQFQFQLKESLIHSGMETIAKENLFEPNIYLESIEGEQFMFTVYHLQLKDKIGAVKALIEFYRKIVDLL